MSDERSPLRDQAEAFGSLSLVTQEAARNHAGYLKVAQAYHEGRPAVEVIPELQEMGIEKEAIGAILGSIARKAVPTLARGAAESASWLTPKMLGVTAGIDAGSRMLLGKQPARKAIPASIGLPSSSRGMARMASMVEEEIKEAAAYRILDQACEEEWPVEKFAMALVEIGFDKDAAGFGALMKGLALKHTPTFAAAAGKVAPLVRGARVLGSSIGTKITKTITPKDLRGKWRSGVFRGGKGKAAPLKGGGKAAPKPKVGPPGPAGPPGPVGAAGPSGPTGAGVAPSTKTPRGAGNPLGLVAGGVGAGLVLSS